MEFNLQCRSITDDMLKKRWLRMKIISLFLFIALLPISANTLSQTINFDQEFNGNNLEEFMMFVETQSGYKFFLSNSEINTKQKVDRHIGKISIDNAVGKVFNKLGLAYKITDDKSIIVLSKNAENGVQVNTHIVRGIIKDDTGATLPGVSVLIKGTTTGTITDINGKYNLGGIKAGDVLVFSFVGMKKQEVTISNQRTINLTLKASAIGLDEVVAIGYGTTTKRKNVGAMTTMKSEKLEKTPFSNVSEAMQGQVAGVIVNSEGGAPGSVPTISIRGGGKPLYVIDGVMIDKDDDFSFSSLNSNDIESMSFLKDAAATAVYGSRAGNGIVLITTKKGAKGKPRVNYSYNLQLSQPTVKPRQISTYEYYSMLNDASFYDGKKKSFSDDVLNTIKNGSDLTKYPNTNWSDLGLKDFTVDHRHNLSLSGGDKITKYFLSLGYFDQEGILKSGASNLQRYNIRGNISTKIEKIGLDIGLNLNSSIQKVRQPSNSYSTTYRMLTGFLPDTPAYNKDGSLSGEPPTNPLALASMKSGYQKDEDSFFNTQLTLKWHVPNIKGLTIGGMANLKKGNTQDKIWDFVAKTYYKDGSLRPTTLPTLSAKQYNKNKLDLEADVNYTRSFGKHELQLTGVYSRISRTKDMLQAGRINYLSNDLDQITLGPAGGRTNDGNRWESASEGYVGRVKYDFASRYVVEFNFRYDGNDNFAKNHKWGFFPSVSAAWVVSDESFMKSLSDKNILNLLKLRLSTGETGITEGVNRFGYMMVYNSISNEYSIGNSLQTGFSEGDLVDPSQLTWYTRNSKNIGIDFSSLHNKLEGTFDYFYYRTSGYLVSPSKGYTATLGKKLPQIKSGSVQRRAGFEFSLNYKQKIHNFSYNVGLNYSHYNQLWKQKDDESDVSLKNPYVRQTNQTDNFGSMYLSSGLYQNANEIINSARPLGSRNTRLGNIGYIDANGDGKIDQSDMRRVGMPTFPHSTYGVDFGAKYKGWFASGLVQGTGDRYISMGGGYQNDQTDLRVTGEMLDYWTPNNRGAYFPGISSSRQGAVNNKMNSDYWILNAKYIRLKMLQFGYDLKYSVLKRQSWISSCRVFISGTNLLTFSDVTDYFDPESKGGGTDIKSFTGRSGYPVQRTYQFGVSVGF